MFKGFTKCSDRIVNYLAALETKRYGHNEVFPEHVIVALLKNGNGIAHKIIGQIVDPVHLQMMLENHIIKIDSMPQQIVAVRKKFKNIEAFYNLKIKVSLSQRMHECLYSAIERAHFLRADSLDTFVLFIACCIEKDSALARIVHELGLSFENLHSYYHRFSKYIALYENEIREDSAGLADIDTSDVSHIKVDGTVLENLGRAARYDIEFNKISDNKTAQVYKKLLKKQVKKEPEDDLNRYITDLTEKMFHKKTALHGRDKEMQQVFRVLLRDYKRNPLLVGDPGVGKTAIVEELARRICWGEAPLYLLHARILQIDIAAMTAGTRFRGDFEERLCRVLDYVKRQSASAPIIVFIDEFHHLVGAGLSSGTTMDAAGILKPALARGELCCIGATTVEEYQKHIETDKAFARRFMPVAVEELSEESTVHALQSIKPAFEKKHSVMFEDSALREVVRLTRNYMPDRKLPDKAIDILDEVGSFYNFKKTDATPELVHLYHSMHSLLEQAEHHVQSAAEAADHQAPAAHPSALSCDGASSSYAGDISQMNEQLHNIIARKSELQNALKVLSAHSSFTVQPRHVRIVMSEITGIPTDRMNLEKSDLIKTLDQDLNSKIIGQHKAVESLVSAIKRSIVGLRDERRPVGSFLFLGPTGVGKTHTVRQLAQHLFGSEDSVMRYDMSDFSEQHAVSRLIGAPPGYVGFEDGGLLIKNVRRKPRQILLFDEIEKAHPKIFDIFLQIFDEGVLHGHRGEKADFRHCIIVMTSNIGAEEFFAGSSVGFESSNSDTKIMQEQASASAKKMLEKTFSPEFLNRLDEIVCFNSLTSDIVEKIIDVMTAPLCVALEKQGVQLIVAESAKELLQFRFFIPEHGARSIRKGIRIMENVLADALLDHEICAGDTAALVAVKSTFRVKRQHSAHEAYVRIDADTEVSASVSASA